MTTDDICMVWLIETCRLLVDRPADVKITSSEHPSGKSMMLIHCHPSDVGKLIGRYGETIRSLRALAYCLGVRHLDARLVVDVYSTSNHDIIKH